MAKTYRIDWRSTAGGFVANVYVPGENLGRSFRPGDKKDKRPVRQRAEEYAACLEAMGYTREVSQAEQDFEEVITLGGDTSVLLSGMPVRCGDQIVRGDTLRKMDK